MVAAAILVMGPALAAEGEEAATAPKGPWSDSTELSLVATEGNAKSLSFGLKNTLEYKKEKSLWRLRVDALRTDESDDNYLQVDSGLIFEPGEIPTGPTTHAVRPGLEPDVERYFVEGLHEHEMSKKTTWNAGASWDRNEDAGILNRSIVFAGVGNVWQDRPDRDFRTSYGLSYTDREEEIQDPEKDEQFTGARLGAHFKDLWGAVTTFDTEFTFNLNLQDTSDYNVDLAPSVSVAMSKKLSMKVSLQALYASEPALEDVDVIARVQIVDPDGIPGNGDEYFLTIDSGGSEITTGEGTLRKKNLDLAFRASLLITF
jgi:putative salt-induced outer membrane protein YdiY